MMKRGTLVVYWPPASHGTTTPIDKHQRGVVVGPYVEDPDDLPMVWVTWLEHGLRTPETTPDYESDLKEVTE